jgi:Holliday junction resolvase RusA-like endonuclease
VTNNVTFMQNGKTTIGQEWHFTIDKPMGYVRTTQMQKWVDPDYKRYQAYKTAVALTARNEGVPNEIQEGHRAQVEVFCTFPNEKHADLDNILKGVLDAIWRQDRRVSRIWAELTVDPMSRAKADVVVRVLKLK